MGRSRISEQHVLRAWGAVRRLAGLLVAHQVPRTAKLCGQSTPASRAETAVDGTGTIESKLPIGPPLFPLFGDSSSTFKPRGQADRQAHPPFRSGRSPPPLLRAVLGILAKQASPMIRLQSEIRWKKKINGAKHGWQALGGYPQRRAICVSNSVYKPNRSKTDNPFSLLSPHPPTHSLPQP
jgi:hypothetical protein